MAAGKKTGGRKKGSVNKATVAKRLIRKEIVAPAASAPAAANLSPLEVMLANMVHFHRLACDAEKILEGVTAGELAGMAPEGEPLDEKTQFEILLAHVRKAADLRLQAQACAKDAAVYLHPRLAPQEPGKRADEAVPLAERLKEYARRDQIAASEGKVVALKR